MIETTGTADDVCCLNPRVSLSGLHVTQIPRHCLWTGRRLGWSWRLLDSSQLFYFMEVHFWWKETNRILSSKLSRVYVHVIMILMMIMMITMTIAMTMIEKPNLFFFQPTEVFVNVMEGEGWGPKTPSENKTSVKVLAWKWSWPLLWSSWSLSWIMTIIVIIT